MKFFEDGALNEVVAESNLSDLNPLETDSSK
jgi:hypothetical protein